ncbi:hypothetical protein SHLI107390_01710 [Shewanella livingstonensis]
MATKGLNTVVGQFESIFCLWPAATKVVALRPHQSKRKPTAVPSLLFIKELAPAVPATFSLFIKQQLRKNCDGK